MNIVIDKKGKNYILKNNLNFLLIEMEKKESTNG